MLHKIFIAVAATLGLGALAGLALYLYERPKILRVAVEHGSDDQAILAAAAQKFVRDHEPIRLKLIPVADAAEAAQSFEQDRTDLAVVRTDIDMPSDGQSVLIMRKDLVILIAPPGSALHSIGDLKGHRLGVLRNTPLAGTHGRPGLVDTILRQYEVPPHSVTTVALSSDAVRQAVATKQVDAILAVGVPDTGVLAKLVREMSADGARPVFIPIAEAKAIADRSPFFESADVMRGLFGGLPPRPVETFETLSVGTRLVAQRTLKDETVTALTKLLLTVRPVLALRIPVANRIEAPSTDRGEALPVHPGAAAYLDDDEESFFDKYSDAIYIGALCLSALGSAAAALASRMKGPNEADDVTLARLIAIAKISRTADAATLDALEADVDELLAATLQRMLARADDQRIHALGIALQHARDALAKRRKAIAAPARQTFEPRLVVSRDSGGAIAEPQSP